MKKPAYLTTLLLLALPLLYWATAEEKELSTSLPDLTVVKFGMENSAVAEYQPQTLWAKIRNNGDAPTPKGTSHAVTFYELQPNGERKMLTYSSNFKGPLAPGEEAVVKADQAWVPRAGDYQLLALADDVNRIKEADEANNRLTQSFTVAEDREIRGLLSEAPVPPVPTPSPWEAFPNGAFQRNAEGQVADWENLAFETMDDRQVLWARKPAKLEWDARGKLLWNTDYVLTCDVKTVRADVPGQPNAGVRLVIWPRLPDQHEPVGGPVYGPTFKGTKDWHQVKIPFRMGEGVSRFIIFLDVPQQLGGLVYLANVSIRPVDTTPLPLPTAGQDFGPANPEEMSWIWSEPGFEWEGGKVGQTTTLVLGGHMGRAMIKPVPRKEAWFRRSFELPPGASEVQAVFVGDDSAELEINGNVVGRNLIWQEIQRVDLTDQTQEGSNTATFRVVNESGLAGLLGRLEWKDAKGKRHVLPTNTKWKTSTDEGETWRPAEFVAEPVPALSAFAWAYPHLPKETYTLEYTLPEDVSAARFRGRASNSFRLLADGEELGIYESAGVPAAIDLNTQLNGKKKLELVFEELGTQPPAGNGVLELSLGEKRILVPVEKFAQKDGGKPQLSKRHRSVKSWPISLLGFETAATRPSPHPSYQREQWAKVLIGQGKLLWQIGTPNGSSQEFGAMGAGTSTMSATAKPKEVSRGLERSVFPKQTINFTLDKVPSGGALFVLDVEDTDAVVTQCAVSVNGDLAGLLQLVGYDQLPGRRLTQRAWAVTIDPERLQVGDNTLTLRLVAPYYNDAGQKVDNQSEEYIRQLALGNRQQNPYGSPDWLHWDALSLYALEQRPADYVNGRPAILGTNAGHYFRLPIKDWQDWILRDLQYMGMTGIQAPLRIGTFAKGQLRFMTKEDPALPEGTRRGDWIFDQLEKIGIIPYVNMEPGRGIRTTEELADSHEANVMNEFGQDVAHVEIGNEVDHPNYGFDLYSLAMAASTIQKAATAGQKINEDLGLNDVELIGQGWYHAWDFSTLDAQARPSIEGDPAYTENLAAHSYGMSYIIPAVTYSTLYGPTLGDKNIWVTECGAWTEDDINIQSFDFNIRGNLAYATHIVQYTIHPYSRRHLRFSTLNAQNEEAEVLEKARAYRRLVLAYGMKGQPLPWKTASSESGTGNVLVRAVDAGKWWKIALINFESEPQTMSVEVTLPEKGTFSAVQYRDGKTVEEGTKQMKVTASPVLKLSETLAPGEAIEWLITKPKGEQTLSWHRP